jgi:hypothetical protein
MEINCPVISSDTPFDVSYQGYGKGRTQQQWLLELETDGTIRHARSHPAENEDGKRSVVGSNLFDLAPVLGGMTDLKRNFIGFVKSKKNRETSCLRTQHGSELSEAIIVLTRSYDTSWPARREIVMMEIRT